jgi:hypothetical protein
MEREFGRGIMSTTHTDSDNEQVSLAELYAFMERINSDRKIRWGVGHNWEFPPKGILNNASIHKKGEHYYLEADYKKYDKGEILSWDETLYMESFSNGNRFSEVENTPPEITTISVDPHSFNSKADYKMFLHEVQKDGFSLETEEHFRKAQTPDPEIIFTIAKGTILYHIFKPIAKKIGEKIADKVASLIVDNSSNFYKFISRSIGGALQYCTPKNRPLFVIFRINQLPNIELIAKTRNHDLVIKSIEEKKLAPVVKQIKELSGKFDIDKIQFKLNDNGKWKFTYLLTAEGAAVGKLEVFKKRDRKLEIMIKSSGNKIYNSIGFSKVKN